MYLTIFLKIAPFIVDLKMYGDTVPLAVFGGVALLAGLLVTFMPETSNTPLPDTILVTRTPMIQNVTHSIYRTVNTLALATASGPVAEKENLSKPLKYKSQVSFN